MTRSKLASSLAIAGALVALARPVAAQPEPERTCIVFEDDSFECGYVAPGGYLDRTRPYVLGCIPDGVCDSVDGLRGEGLDDMYTQTVFPTDDPRYPEE